MVKERYPGRHRYVYVDGGGVEGMLSISGRTVTVGKAQYYLMAHFVQLLPFYVYRCVTFPVDSVAESQTSAFRPLNSALSFLSEGIRPWKLSAHHVACSHSS